MKWNSSEMIDQEIQYGFFDSPIGELRVGATSNGIRSLTINEKDQLSSSEVSLPIFAAVTTQLSEYFSGHRKDFDLDLDLTGNSTFYMRVWHELLQVPYGKSISYGELASLVGAPNGAQAVGLANSKNPIGIIVPCHRVIGKNGSLTGYAWGVEKKRWLLLHELDHSEVPQGRLF